MIEGLSRFARRASSTTNAYVRGRQGASRAKAAKVFGPIEASNADPAALAGELQERLDGCDATEGRVWLEVLAHGDGDVIESLAVDVSDTPGPAAATHADGLVGRAMDALIASTAQANEAAAEARAAALAAIERSARNADQRDAAIEDAWRERVKAARGERADADADEKSPGLSPYAEKMLSLGAGILLQRLTGQPLALPGPAQKAVEPAAPSTDGGDADALDAAITTIVDVVARAPALVTIDRVRRLEPLLDIAMGAIMSAPSDAPSCK